eukprot:4386208-Amphidinium_carterae.1
MDRGTISDSDDDCYPRYTIFADRMGNEYTAMSRKRCNVCRCGTVKVHLVQASCAWKSWLQPGFPLWISPTDILDAKESQMWAETCYVSDVHVTILGFRPRIGAWIGRTSEDFGLTFPSQRMNSLLTHSLHEFSWMPCILKIEDRWIPMHLTQKIFMCAGFHDARMQDFGCVNIELATNMPVVRIVSLSSFRMVL